MNDIETDNIINFIDENFSSIVNTKEFTKFSLNRLQKKLRRYLLTNNEAERLINAFVKLKMVLNINSPMIFRQDNRCIESSINSDINSIDWIDFNSYKNNEALTKLAIEKGYVMSTHTPSFLASNVDIIENSLKFNIRMCELADWSLIKLNKENYDRLVNFLIENKYTISNYTPEVLRGDPELVLSSYNLDKKTIRYAKIEAFENNEVFKKKLLDGYATWEEISYVDITKYNKKMIQAAYDLYVSTHYTMKDFDTFVDIPFERTQDKKKYIDRTVDFTYEAVNAPTTVETLKKTMKAYVEISWYNYYRKHNDDYANIFAKICNILKTDEDVNNIPFINKMKSTLGPKYNELEVAMKQYRIAINAKNIVDIEKHRDTISKLSALYISFSKDNYINKTLEKCMKTIKKGFIPRKDCPLVQKKLIEEKQKNAFQKLFENEDPIITKKINNIINEYKDCSSIEVETLHLMLSNFILLNESKLDSFIKAPRGWNNHKRYLEAVKLINRLNQHFLKYTDQEIFRYKDIIKYDKDKEIYYYDGPTFTEESLIRYDQYRNKLRIFEKIKQRIAMLRKEINVDKNITDEQLNSIVDELPFDDTNFVFNMQNKISFAEFFNSLFCSEKFETYFDIAVLIDDYYYSKLREYVKEYGLIWLLIIGNLYGDSDLHEIVDLEQLQQILCSMATVSEAIDNFTDGNITFNDIPKLFEIANSATERELAILGPNMIYELCTQKAFTDYISGTIVELASNMICQRVTRNYSTVPFVEGETENYKYSMYDFLDDSILLAGINTDACFRIDGNDNDFLHYCALDKNGFVLKFTDLDGNFIARAGGFRNGNCVFINQLRTIYDKSGGDYNGTYSKEKREIIKAFEKACIDIVDTSQNTDEEKDKIDYVFVNKSYILHDYDFTNVIPTMTSDEISSYPMDYTSEDWYEFVDTTLGLQENYNEEEPGFRTDYGDYQILCMANSKYSNDFGHVMPQHIYKKDVEPVYKRSRNKIQVITDIDQDTVNKIERIRALCSFESELSDCDKLLDLSDCDDLFNDAEHEAQAKKLAAKMNEYEAQAKKLAAEMNEYEQIYSVDSFKDCTIFLGDNWYIIYKNGKISDFNIVNGDIEASKELYATLYVLQPENKNVKDIHCLIDFEFDENGKKVKTLTLYRG